MRRGDVWWVDLSAAAGSETHKTRPAVIVSSDLANEFTQRVQIVPLSSQVSKLYPCEALVRVAGKQSKAMADQIVTADKRRLTRRVGRLAEADMRGVERAIRVQLALD
jgi:mRNA interferase MazF